MRFLFPLLMVFAVSAYADVELSVLPDSPVVNASDFVGGPNGETHLSGNWFQMTPQIWNNSQDVIEVVHTAIEVTDRIGAIVHQSVVSNNVRLAAGEPFVFPTYFVGSLPKDSTKFSVKFSLTGMIFDKETGEIKNFGSQITIKTL